MIAPLLVTLALQLVSSTPARPALSGWLVDPDGVRIEGAVLILEPLDGQPPARFAANPTDASGAWRLDGLAPGRWRPTLRHFGPSLDSVRFDPAELLVPSPPQRVVADVARVSMPPGEDSAFCVQVPDASRVLESGEHLADPLGARAWLVRRDARTVVGSWSMRRGLSEVEVAFAPDAAWLAQVHPALLPPESLGGRVELVVPRPVGVRIRLSVLAPKSRHELLRVEPELGPMGPGSTIFRVTLPPGDYLLRVEEPDPALFCLMPGDSTWERRNLRAIESSVHVTSGSRQQLERAWDAGVRPTLRFDAPGASAVFLWELDDLGRCVRPVGCEPHSRGLVIGDFMAWPDGVAHPAREPLPVGRVRLLAGADGFAPREFELELVAGEPCEARIALSALERETQELTGERAERSR